MKRRNGTSISDARLRHFEQFKKRFEPLNEIPDEIHIPVSTERSLEACIQKILSQDHLMPDREGTEKDERRTSVRTWLWFVAVRDIEALPGKA